MSMLGIGTKIRYGRRRGQFGVLTRPRGATPTAIVVLIHGGFWTWPYNRWLMLGLARSVRQHGWASFNVEYRRLGRFGGGGGFPETFEDVASAVGLAVEAARARRQSTDGHGLPVAIVGHSAGGQLALWAAREVAGVEGVVSMAAPTDLRSIARGGSGPVSSLVARAPEDRRWELTSPMQRLPVGVPTVCVHSTHDATVSPRNAEAYAAAAAAAGDDASAVLIDGEKHRDAVRPMSSTWSAALDALKNWCPIDMRR